MRIALVQLKKEFTAANAALQAFVALHSDLFREYSMPHLGLLTLAAATPAGHDVTFHDENTHPLDLDELAADLVGISTLTQDASRAYALADRLRRRGIRVVLGGIHATVCTDEALAHADHVVRGEAEPVWATLLADIEAGRAGRIYDAVPGTFDIQASPVPAYRLLSDSNHQQLEGRLNMIPLQTSRGCPRRCEFCSASAIWGERQRVKPVAQVMAEVREVKSIFGRPLICFADDNMFLDRDNAKAILRALADEHVPWMTQSDLSIADDDELLELCYRSHCDHIFFGFESVDEANLDQISPGQFKLEQFRQATKRIRRIQEAGIPVYASIMVGLDHDTPEVMEATVAFVLEHHLFPHFCVATPLPGTALYRRIVGERRLLAEDYWDRCTFFDVTFEPLHLSAAEVEHWVVELFERTWAPEVHAARMRHTREMYRSAIGRFGKLTQ